MSTAPSFLPFTRFCLSLLLLVSACELSSASTLVDHWQAEPQPTPPGRFLSTPDCPRAHSHSAHSAADRAINNSATTTPTRLQLSSNFSLPLQSAALGAAGETALMLGAFIDGTLRLADDYAYFSYRPAALNAPFDLFLDIGGCETSYCDIHVLTNGEPFADVYNATREWHYSTALRFDSSSPFSCEARSVPLEDCEYHFSLQTWSDAQRYSIVVTAPPASVAQLTSGRAQEGTVDGGAAAYFFLTNGALEDVMVFALTATQGDCDLYVSTTTERPGPDEYTWSSVDDGDDLVVVNGSTAGPGGRRGMYYFLGVHNKRASSSSAYSLVGSGYSTSGDPLYNAGYLTADVSQRDYAMAGTYRYYYVSAEGVWPVMTITLDSLRGDADM